MIKKIDLGQALTILANIGVLLGILLLVYELNQNRQTVQGQTRTSMTEGVTNLLYQLSTDPEVADVLYRGDIGGELTPLESRRYLYFVLAQLRYHENAFYQYQNGLYDESEYSAQRTLWRNNVFSRKGTVRIWCQEQAGFSPEFAAEVNSLLTTNQCD